MELLYFAIILWLSYCDCSKNPCVNTNNNWQCPKKCVRLLFLSLPILRSLSFIPEFPLMYLPAVYCFCLFHGNTCQEERYRLVWWHRCSHFYRPLIFSIESFNPVCRIYAPLHLHGKVHVSKVSHVLVGFILPQYSMISLKWYGNVSPTNLWVVSSSWNRFRTP